MWCTYSHTCSSGPLGRTLALRPGAACSCMHTARRAAAPWPWMRAPPGSESQTKIRQGPRPRPATWGLSQGAGGGYARNPSRLWSHARSRPTWIRCAASIPGATALTVADVNPSSSSRNSNNNSNTAAGTKSHLPACSGTALPRRHTRRSRRPRPAGCTTPSRTPTPSGWRRPGRRPLPLPLPRGCSP